MSIETGFRNFGFVDDREEQDRWNKIEQRLSTPSQPASQSDTSSQPNSDIDAKFDIKDESPTKEWQEDMKEQMKSETKRQSTETGFFQRNKRQIFDALIVLGVIYVGYKLFFEKDDNVEFEGGGETAYAPPPPPPTPAPAPVAPAPVADAAPTTAV